MVTFIRQEGPTQPTLIFPIHPTALFFLRNPSILWRSTEMNVHLAVKDHAKEIVLYSFTIL